MTLIILILYDDFMTDLKFFIKVHFTIEFLC